MAVRVDQWFYWIGEPHESTSSATRIATEFRALCARRHNRPGPAAEGAGDSRPTVATATARRPRFRLEGRRGRFVPRTTYPGPVANCVTPPRYGQMADIPNTAAFDHQRRPDPLLRCRPPSVVHRPRAGAVTDGWVPGIALRTAARASREGQSLSSAMKSEDAIGVENIG